MGSMVDGPGVARNSVARRHARHHGIEPLAAEPVASDGGGIGHVDGADLGAFVRPRAARAADQADHLMPALRQRAKRRATDRAGAAEQTDALGALRRVFGAHASR